MLPFYKEPESLKGLADNEPITATYTAGDARRAEEDHYLQRATMILQMAAALLSAFFFLRAILRND